MTREHAEKAREVLQEIENLESLAEMKPASMKGDGKGEQYLYSEYMGGAVQKTFKKLLKQKNKELAAI